VDQGFLTTSFLVPISWHELSAMNLLAKIYPVRHWSVYVLRLTRGWVARGSEWREFAKTLCSQSLPSVVWIAQGTGSLDHFCIICIGCG